MNEKFKINLNQIFKFDVNFKLNSILLKKIISYVLVLSLHLVVGCSSEEDQSADVFSFENVEYKTLLDDLTDLEIAIALKQVLQNTPERTRIGINNAMARARAGLLSLSRPGERTLEEKKQIHRAFLDAIKQYEDFRILEVEQDRFDRVFNQVRYLKFNLSVDLGLDESDQTWTIFNHNFSTSGLEPTFTTMGFDKTGKPNDESKWFTNFQTDIPKARAQGRDGSYGWMISRPFDLSEVVNPSFRYFGSYLVVAPNNVLPLAEVITSVFKTYILLDYQPGDNPESYPADRKILVKYDLDQLPLGRDFDDAWVPYTSLNEYKDRQIAIGFLFDTRGVNFTQYYSWTVFDFELNGAGKIKEDPVKYKEQFQGAGLGTYKSYSLEFPGENFKVQNAKATIESLGAGDPIDTFLLSPKLDIPIGLKVPELRIVEYFKKENFSLDLLSDYQIQISKDFKGGQSPLNANWDVLERKSSEVVEVADGFVLTNIFSLEKYSGHEIVVGFRFKAIPDQKKYWGIESVEVLGADATVTEIDYRINDASEQYRLAYFDFLKSNLTDYTITSEEQAPVWKKKENGIVISGFAGNGNPILIGVTRLTLPEIDLTGKSDARIRLKQKVFFFKDPNLSPRVVRLEIRKSGEMDWTTLEVPEGTFRDGMPRDPELSGWIRLPEEYLNQKIEISFRYQAFSGNGGTVEWTLSSFEVGSK